MPPGNSSINRHVQKKGFQSSVPENVLKSTYDDVIVELEGNISEYKKSNGSDSSTASKTVEKSSRTRETVFPGSDSS
jgi:hypothetical protein